MLRPQLNTTTTNKQTNTTNSTKNDENKQIVIK